MQTLPSEAVAPATSPTWKSPVSVANILSVLTAAPAVIEDLLKIDIGIPNDWKYRLLGVAAVIRVILPYLQRRSTVTAVQAVEAKLGTVAETTAAVVDPHTETPAGAAETLRAVAESSKP
jgi:hypothetical protein